MTRAPRMIVRVYENLTAVPESLVPSQCTVGDQLAGRSFSKTKEKLEQNPLSLLTALKVRQSGRLRIEGFQEKEHGLMSGLPEQPDRPPIIDHVPTTEKEAQRLMFHMAGEQYLEARADKDYEGSSSKPEEEKKPMKRWKLNWRQAKLLGALALLEDDEATASHYIKIELDIWAQNPSKAKTAVQESLGRFLQAMRTVAGTWMGERAKEKKLLDAVSAGLDVEDMANIEVVEDIAGASMVVGLDAADPTQIDDAYSLEVEGPSTWRPATTGTKRSAPEPVPESETPKKKQKQAESVDAQPQGNVSQKEVAERKRREAADLKAQETVKGYYGGICVLTGHGNARPAQGYPVNIRDHPKADVFWTVLEYIWPRAMTDKWRELLESELGRVTSIIPMEATAHDMFDRLEFALEPLPCPSGSDRRILLVVHTKLGCTISRQTGGDGAMKYTLKRVENKRNHRAQFLTNCRKPIFEVNGSRRGFEELIHGNVIEIITPDPERLPLPNLNILKCAYHITKLVAALKAVAGSRKGIFRGETPEINPVPPGWGGDRALGEFEELMLDLAVNEGRMTSEEQGRWRAYAIHEAREKLRRGVYWSGARRGYRGYVHQ